MHLAGSRPSSGKGGPSGVASLDKQPGEARGIPHLHPGVTSMTWHFPSAPSSSPEACTASLPYPCLSVSMGLGPVSVAFGPFQRTHHAESLAKTLEEYRTTAQVGGCPLTLSPLPSPTLLPSLRSAASLWPCPSLVESLHLVSSISTVRRSLPLCFHLSLCLFSCSLLPFSLSPCVSPSWVHFHSLWGSCHHIAPAHLAVCLPFFDLVFLAPGATLLSFGPWSL